VSPIIAALLGGSVGALLGSLIPVAQLIRRKWEQDDLDRVTWYVSTYASPPDREVFTCDSVRVYVHRGVDHDWSRERVAIATIPISEGSAFQEKLAEALSVAEERASELNAVAPRKALPR